MRARLRAQRAPPKLKVEGPSPNATGTVEAGGFSTILTPELSRPCAFAPEWAAMRSPTVRSPRIIGSTYVERA